MPKTRSTAAAGASVTRSGLQCSGASSTAKDDSGRKRALSKGDEENKESKKPKKSNKNKKEGMFKYAFLRGVQFNYIL